MTKRIFTGIISVAVAVIILCGVFLTGILYGHFNERVYTELENEAFLIAEGISAEGEAYLEDIGALRSRITLIEQDGAVTFDSEKDAAQMDDHSTREEVREAFSSGEGRSSRYSDTIGMQTLYYARKLEDGRVIRVAVEVNSVWTLVLGVLQPMVFVLMLALIAAAVLSGYISKTIVKPINEIELGSAELDEPYDELAPLVHKIRTQNVRIDEQMKQLRRQQKEFRLITDNMSEGFLVIDNKTEILSYNTSALRLLDVAEDEDFSGRSVLTLNRSESFRTAVEDAISGRHSEQPMTVGESSYHIVANPVLHKGEVTGAILIILDVTEKEQREQLRREFTSNVSHELKTPLTTIYGIADMLCAGIVKQEDIKGFAGNIRSESQRMITLIEDIIKLSQLDEGGSGIEKCSVDLLTVAEAVEERLRYQAEKAEVSITVEGENSTINGAPAIIDEMMYNLVENAIKYNRSGGSVRITVGCGFFEVTDTGVGIPADAQERVFERFYRVDKSHSRRIGGTGLGLSIVKHGAQFHNAAVELESTENVGTRIRVIF